MKITAYDQSWFLFNTLQWRHNGHDSVTNHQPRDCLLNRLFRRRSKKTSKLRVTGLCAGNSPGTGEFPAQMASNAENVSEQQHRKHQSYALLPSAEGIIYSNIWKKSTQQPFHSSVHSWEDITVRARCFFTESTIILLQNQWYFPQCFTLISFIAYLTFHISKHIITLKLTIFCDGEIK